MNNVAIFEQRRELTAAEVRGHVNLIQEVMQAVMKKDTHYGVIPGCKQPSLYKAGAEVLLTTFRIAVEPEVTDLSTADEIRFRVRAKGIHQTTGIVVGVGVGECSTGEDKYKWRKAVCDAEFEATPETRRRVKFQKGGYANGSYDKNAIIKINQVRTEPADLANTVLKMAKKRAQIDLTLTAMAASDIFTQDIEDMPEELRDDEQPEKKTVSQPQSKSKPESKQPPTDDGPIGDGPKRIIRAKLEAGAITETQLCQKFGVASVDVILRSQINAVLAWLANPDA